MHFVMKQKITSLALNLQASDNISELEQTIDSLKRSLKDAEDQRQRQIRVGNGRYLFFHKILYIDFNSLCPSFTLLKFWTYLHILLPSLSYNYKM